MHGLCKVYFEYSATRETFLIFTQPGMRIQVINSTCF